MIPMASRVLRLAVLALVLALLGLPTPSFAQISSTITALNGTAVLPVSGDIQTVSVQLSGTWVATIIFEATFDAGTTWFTLAAVTLPAPGGSPVSSVTANGQWALQVAGLSAIRVRASAFTSGTATVTFLTGTGSQAFGNLTVTSIGHGTPRNSTGSGVNLAVAATITGLAGQFVRIDSVVASCSAGTATLTIADAATTVFSMPAAASFTLNFGFPGVMISAGNTGVVTLGACGATNTGTLNVVAVQY
jgi:hypothetical protein